MFGVSPRTWWRNALQVGRIGSQRCFIRLSHGALWANTTDVRVKVERYPDNLVRHLFVICSRRRWDLGAR